MMMSPNFPHNDVANAFVTWLRHASHHLKVVL